MATSRLLPPATHEYGEARARYLEHDALLILHNRYLRLAVLALSAVVMLLATQTVRTLALARSVKPIVIRIDDVGRATALSPQVLEYKPQAPELKYFLTQFVVRHYSRLKATVREQFAQSLFFLDGRLADGLIDAAKKSQVIETFLVKGDEEIDVQVRRVALEDLRQPPYKATIDFDKVFYTLDDHRERRRETYTAHVVFVLRDQIPNALIPVNPLGLTITYFRDDQAFR
jgi:type IV secretory pathway TrbF-like protein